jgi:hypothetical protein
MAGRYQGRHILTDVDHQHHRTVEVFWSQTGWFWRPCQLPSDAVGPFTTSTEAYQHAKSRCLTEPAAG